MNRIKKIRTEQQLTQQELADKAGINIRLVQRLEKEEVSIMESRVKTIKGIADALNLKIDDLI